MNSPTTTLLRDTLRDATGQADLEFAAPPTPLTGGYPARVDADEYDH